MEKKIYAGILTNTLVQYRAEIFNALGDRTTIPRPELDAINTANGFISTSVPVNTLEGLIKIASQGNNNGLISWFGATGATNLLHNSDDGARFVAVAGGGANFSSGSPTFCYRQLIEFLKSNDLKVTKAKITVNGNNSQLQQPWTWIERQPDGQKTEEVIYMVSNVSPDQVRIDTAIVDINRTINKFTAIQFDVLPGTLSINIEFTVTNI